MLLSHHVRSSFHFPLLRDDDDKERSQAHVHTYARHTHIHTQMQKWREHSARLKLHWFISTLRNAFLCRTGIIEVVTVTLHSHVLMQDTHT